MNKKLILTLCATLQSIIILGSQSPSNKSTSNKLHLETSLMYCVGKSQNYYLPNNAYFNVFDTSNDYKSLGLSNKEIEEALKKNYTPEQAIANSRYKKNSTSKKAGK